MNLRNLNIGVRLGVGFGVILLAAGVLLAGSMISGAANRGKLQGAMQAAMEREELAFAMRGGLLTSAIAVRNMGLQTTMEAVQKDEALAKSARQAYLASRGKLESQTLSDEERAIFQRLASIDQDMDKQFKEAVDLAAQFNTEQAAAVITSKIDPLLNRAVAELNAFIEFQKQRSVSAVEQANAGNRVAQWLMAGAGIAVLAVAALLAWRLTLSITGPLHTAVEAAARVAQGNLSADIVVTGHDEAASLLRALKDMRDSLARMVSAVREGAQTIDRASQEIATGNADLSSRTESQASSLQQTCASVEHLTDVVRQSSQNAEHAQQLSHDAAGLADKGQSVVSQVVGTMSTINENSRKIGEITTVINSIAFQTNLLALNAAIEAARAGEHGRGFAVVASEVRTLSQSTTRAAKEIEELIQSAVSSTQSGSELVDEAGRAMSEVTASVRQVAGIISEISDASRQQTTGIEEVNLAIADIDRSTQQNSAMVEQAAAAAASMREQTGRLSQLVSAFEV